jgi:hypothetical protein
VIDMIVAFESEDSKHLSDYLKHFEFPETMPSTFKNVLTMLSLNLYFERKIYRKDNLVVMRIRGFVEEMAKYAIYFFFAGILFGYMLNINFISMISLYLILPCMMLISADFRTWMITLKLKWSGHKPKIKSVSKDYVIQKLLYEVTDGARRDIPIIKE